MKKKIRIFILSIITFFSISAFSQVAKYQAIYLYNFSSYIEWPSSYRTGDFVIGVLGSNDPIVKELQIIAKTKKVLRQRINIVSFNNVNEITKCHILFVSARQSAKIKEAKAKIGSNSTLLVSSTALGISQGAVINFFIEGKKLSFEIKKANVARGVKISYGLTKLAAKVH